MLKSHLEIFVPLVSNFNNRSNKIHYPANIRKLISRKASAWRRWRELRTAPLKSKYDALARDCMIMLGKKRKTLLIAIIWANSTNMLKKMSSESGIGPLRRTTATLW